MSQHCTTGGIQHHTKAKECPLPIYIFLKIYGARRERSLIDVVYKVGMCVSYDRLLSIADNVCARCKKEAVVYPSLLQRPFTTAVMDSIDT